MLNEFSRTQLLYGKDAMEKLSQSKVPSVVGLIIAGEVINDLCKGYREIAKKEYGIS